MTETIQATTNQEIAIYKPKNEIEEILVDRNESLMRNLPPGIDERSMRAGIWGCVHGNTELLACSKVSLMGAICGCVQYGLIPGKTLHHASIVPFNNKRTGIPEAVLMIEYRGFQELLYRSGTLTDISMGVVYDGDTWEHSIDSSGETFHFKRAGFARDTQRLGAFCCLRLASGGKIISVMSIDAIYSCKPKYLKSDSPWLSKEQHILDEMILKTVERNACKRAPMPKYAQSAINYVGNEEKVKLEYNDADMTATLVEVEPHQVTADDFAAKPKALPAQEPKPEIDLWETMQNEKSRVV